jgi:hypothetical protein
MKVWKHPPSYLWLLILAHFGFSKRGGGGGIKGRGKEEGDGAENPLFSVNEHDEYYLFEL